MGRANDAVRPSIQVHMTWLERELKDLDEDLRQTLRQSPVWRETDDLLRCAPCLAWANNSLCPCWRICRNWVRWTTGRSPHWWELLP